MEQIAHQNIEPNPIPPIVFIRQTDYAPELPPVIKDVKGKRIKYRGRTQIRPEDCTITYTPEMVKEVKRCKKDIKYFAENYFYIISKDEGKKKIELYPKQYEMLDHMHNNRFTATLASRQIGKALALNTPIPTPSGWTTMGELKTGDIVYDEQGKSCTVLMAHEVMNDRVCYKVVFDNGEEIIADEEHLWFTQNRAERQRILKKDAKRVVSCRGDNNGSVKTTKEILETLNVIQYGQKNSNHRILMSKAVEGDYQDLLIDPYLLGVWLGDGTSSGSGITVGEEDKDEMFKNLSPEYYSLKKIKNTKAWTLRIKGKDRKRKTPSLFNNLKLLNLINNKHIPKQYLLANIEQRLELLRGLLDSDGTITKTGQASFSNTNTTLANNVFELILSLGFKPTRKTKIPTYVYKGERKQGKESHGLYFTPLNVPVFKLKRKVERQKTKLTGSATRIQYHYIKSIEKIDSVPVRCITVDSPNSLYLCGKTYIPTHNTTLASIIMLHQAMFHNDFVIGILSNKEKGAKDIIRRVKTAYKELPHWLTQGVTEWNALSIVFENGSRIEAEATSEDSFTGRSLNILYIDETAKVLKNLWDEFWNSAYPTISSGASTKVMMTSTPKGMNHFYRICEDAKNGRTPFKFFQYNWWEVPGRDLKWKEEQIRTLHERGFAQEFGCEFLGSGNTLLSGDALKKLIWQTPISEEKDHHFKVYENPVPGRQYVLGVDTGKGVDLCYSVVQVIDITEFPIKQVAIFRAADVLYTDLPGYILNIAENYFSPIVMVENNDLGQAVVDSLFYDYEYENVFSEFKKPNLGLRTTTKTKKIMLHFLRDMIENNKIIINDYDTISEFGTFIKKANSYVPDDGSTADAIMALAVGAYSLKTDWIDVDQLTQKIARVVHINPEMEEDPDPIMPDGSYGEVTDDEFHKWLIS